MKLLYGHINIGPLNVTLNLDEGTRIINPTCKSMIVNMPSEYYLKIEKNQNKSPNKIGQKHEKTFL